MMKTAALTMVVVALAAVVGCAAAPEEKTGSSEAAFEQTSLQLIRGISGGLHFVQSGYSNGPSGLYEEARYHVNVEGPYTIFACSVRGHVMASRDPGCEGQRRIGTLGGLAPSGIPLYRCNVDAGRDHIITTDPACEGQAMDGLLGYIDSVTPGINTPNTGGSGTVGEGSGDAPGGGDGTGGGSSDGEGGGFGAGGSL